MEVNHIIYISCKLPMPVSSGSIQREKKGQEESFEVTIKGKRPVR